VADELIPLAKPVLGEAEERAVLEVLRPSHPHVPAHREKA